MPFDYQPVLKGELLELRPLSAGDVDALFEAASDPLIWEQHPQRNRHEPDVFRAYFADQLASGGALIVHDARTGETIGLSRYHGYDAERSEVEIGWTFLVRRCWGGVYNRELKDLMLAHAFRFVDNVIFLVAPENMRSRRGVEKIGAVETGMRPGADGMPSVAYRITAPRLNAVGDFVLTDARALRALADPVRLSLFDLVRRLAPATSAALAERVGIEEESVERHLRELGAVGLVASDGTGCWTTRGKGIFFEIPDDDEEVQQAARQLSRVMLAKYADLPFAWARDDEPKLDLEWARAAGLFNARIELTADELREIQEGLERLLEPFSTRSPDDRPAGAAPVRILAFFLPEATDAQA